MQGAQIAQNDGAKIPHKKIGKHGKHHKKSKSHTKKKSKKSGFLCCRGKKRKRSEKKKHKKSKSTTKKQPRSKVVKPLAPVPNEQLGEIVLVKNIDKIKPLSKEQAQSPDKTGPVAKSKEPDSEDKLKSKSKKDEKSEKKVEKTKEEKKEEKKEDDGNTEEKKQKWLGLAKRFVAEDAKIALKDFQQVASYIPPHVTKQNFVDNMEKNRFSDVICLDHSRVTLSDSSYIHANWVDIVPGHKRAILTQMPLTETAADFWQMIIEHRVKSVLLLLTEAEYESLGGDFVFPMNQDFLHFEERSIRVGEFKRVEIMSGWSLRVLSVCNGDYKSFLHVHHYTGWPHNSVPFSGSPQGVKQLWQIQSCFRKYSSSPPVYMSLSGCGRAGTYALFETAHASLHSDDPKLDLVKCLEIVRGGRLHSCQNLTQFSFVYSLLAEHILNNGFCKLAVPKKAGDEKEDVEPTVNTILRQLTITKSSR
ncbi:hypothetical protein CRE_14035 [Caenorhabditis remanei]|uniref:Tyrosine-protein phosphatase domain-containing protein n=1 Tax=Caenorhabditis remanei TaxID=31234 RepID=E3M8X5_CAERE|nr:hypothetical protein CRE_14035 [Caenorhabditis remanei]